jgi:hypothetical protein
VSITSQKADTLLVRDVYKKLSSTFGKNSNKRIAVLKTEAQAKGGSWANVGKTGELLGYDIGTGSIVAQTAGSILGDIFGINSRDIEADVIFSYNHKSSVRLTDNPVESGISINDHRIIEPRILTIEIGINNTDNTTPKQNNAILRGTGLLLFGDSPNSQNKVINTYTDLLACQRNGEPFDIETPIGTYKNMLITGIECRQDADTINVFKGSINFRELMYFELKKSFDLSSVSGVFGSLGKGIQTVQDVTTETMSLLPTSTQSTLRSIF